MTRTYGMVLVVCCLTLCFVSTAAGQWMDRVGWTQLNDEVPDLEDGTGVVASQVEAPQAGDYFPDINHVQFEGKDFTDGSNMSTDPSGHATTMGRFFYGNTHSIAGGVTDITIYEVNDWINDVLNFSGGDPLPQPFHVQNHSWIGTGLTESQAVNILRRADFMVNQNDYMMVVGTNNGGGALPQIMVPGYNSISVGRTNGNHASGFTSFYGDGRVKPVIVAPENATSRTTAIVSSASAMLREAGENLPDAVNATRNETLRAVIMAGATKDDVNGTWSRTSSIPIDTTFGFGELNVYNSYHILQGGEFDGAANEPTELVGLLGWDYEPAIDPTAPLSYEFEISPGQRLAELSIALIWNMEIIDQNGNPNIFSPAEFLVNMDLELYDSTNVIPVLLDSSVSTVENLEHIYQTDLGPGKYTMVVSSDGAHDYALAWRANMESIETVVNPDGFNLIRGIQTQGDLQDIDESDDSYLKVRRISPDALAQVSVWLEFEGTLPNDDPQVLKVTLESAVDAMPIRQRVSMFNFASGQFEEVDSRRTTTADNVIEIDLQGDLSRFVEAGTGRVRTQLTWSDDGLVDFFAWTTCIDQLIWTVQ